jgi:hypothetical protein
MTHIIRKDRRHNEWQYVQEGDSKLCSQYNETETMGPRFVYALVTEEELTVFLA